MATNNFMGEITIFPYTFAPRFYTWCEGQLLAIQQNPSLYSIIGTLYGGDGRTSFGVPHLRGRNPIGWGQGPGLSIHTRPGILGGTSTVTLTASEIPVHAHDITAVFETPPTDNVNNPSVTLNIALTREGTVDFPYLSGSEMVPDTDMADEALSVAGSSIGHENRQPYLAMRFCLAFDGLYPSRN